MTFVIVEEGRISTINPTTIVLKQEVIKNAGTDAGIVQFNWFGYAFWSTRGVEWMTDNNWKLVWVFENTKCIIWVDEIYCTYTKKKEQAHLLN